MSSPLRRSDHSRSSPSRSRINGFNHSRPQSQILQDVSGYCEEMSRLHIDTEKAYQKLLDQRAQEQKRKHIEGLERALEQHEQVQKSARELVERIQLEQQQARLRQEQEEHRKLEEERRKLEETRKKIAEEERNRREIERKREEERQAEAQRKKEEADRLRKAEEQQKKDAEEARIKAERDKVAAEKETRDKAAAAAQAAEAQQLQAHPSVENNNPPVVPAATTNGVASNRLPISVTSSAEERQKVHDAYLAIHQRLKDVRKTVHAAMKSNPQFKEGVYNATRKMRLSVSQITRVDKKGNKEKIQSVMEQIDQALSINEQTDVSNFIFNPPTQPIQGPLILIYMLNRFSKFVLRQLESEVGSLTMEKGDGADAFGIAVALVFSNSKYLVEGRSLIDILWATYHRNCPRLFGVPVRSLPKNLKGFGPLAAGFAAITLRQFPTGRLNPAPNRIYWEALARLVNTPIDKIKRDHMKILEAMLQPVFVSKFIQIYGAAAVVAVRHAILNVAPAVRQSAGDEGLKSEATGVFDLRLTLGSELHLPL